VDGWKEIADADALATQLGFGRITPEAASRILETITQMPYSDRYVKIRIEFPELPPGNIGYMVPRTRIFFNLRRCKEFWGDAMVALATYLFTQSPQAAFIAATIRKVYDNLVLLSEDEAEVIHVLIGLARGDPYGIPVPEEALRSAHTDATVSINDLLDSLERKNVLERRREGKLILVY
jgi:hypothetical protein